MESETCKRPVGRPREFCMESALDRAMQLFWRKGYEGTSLPDLTEAMGISRPSLYAAFGSKEALFRKVIDRYSEHAGCGFTAALKEPTARRVAEKLLANSICGGGGGGAAGRPRGCLLVQAALTCGDNAQPLRQELIQRRSGNEVAIRERFKQAVRDGELASNGDAIRLASFLATVMHGMAVQANGGASKKTLLAVADTALQAFPARDPSPR